LFYKKHKNILLAQSHEPIVRKLQCISLVRKEELKRIAVPGLVGQQPVLLSDSIFLKD
jgi:hypothetical protein